VSAWLRALGVLLGLTGVVTAIVAGWYVTRDVAYAEAAAAYARHPDHPLFQADYYTAAVRHFGLLTLVGLGLVVGLAGGSALLGIAEVLRRLPRR
jgi:hypothetical protein